MQLREPSEAEASFYDYFFDALDCGDLGPGADFYSKCAQFLRAHVQSTDDVSSERLSIEDCLLNVIGRHPQRGLQGAYDEMLKACEESFSPAMREQIQSDQPTRLKREVQWSIHQALDSEEVRLLVQKVYDVAVTHGEVSSYVVGGWMPAPESPFMDLIRGLPKAEQVAMKAKLLDAIKIPAVLNHLLFHTFCLRESQRNPSGTSLLRRAKLTVDEGLAVLAFGRFAPFMSQLVEPNKIELGRALDKVRVSSYGADAFYGHFKVSTADQAQPA